MKKIIFNLCLFLSISVFSQTTHNITNPEDITSLSSSLNAGDTVILADGTYTSDARIKFSPSTGTASNPITFRPQTPGGVIFTGGLKMSIGGDHVIVDGFHWKGGYGASNFIEFRDGSNYANNSFIQNCAIDGLEISPSDKADDQASNSITKHRWIVLYGTNNTVTNCSFLNKNSAGALILVELYYNASASCASVGHKITKNYFYKYAKMDSSLSNSGDSETIRIGSSSNQNVIANVTVSNNYFVEADGENEIITNKSKNNTFTNNTFRRCRGSLVLRHGSNATVQGNVFLGENVDGTGGIRITDSNHNITNNYIQDCVTIQSQAKWNNGITFIGGTANAAVACTDSNTSNGYQESKNITITNNSIVNTNAPLFFNTDKGSNAVTGSITNNLIYFDSGNANISNILTGDTNSSYADIGTSLSYAENSYKGTIVGETNTGFSENLSIAANLVGEIYSFSGAQGKGADLGSYVPFTDTNVGYGIGACFLNNTGSNITDGVCTITPVEYLTVDTLPELNAEAGSYTINVSANVNWTVATTTSWISLGTTSGTGNSSLQISISKNETTSSRAGTITFTQVPGGNDIVQTITISQIGANLTDLYTLINIGGANDPVTINSFSKEEVNGTTKFNYAANTLDKDNSSVWAADDGSIISGDYKGDGEYIIYDLGSEEALKLIQFTTTNKADAFGFQVWVSTTGVANSDFTKILPFATDLIFTKTNSTDFNQFEIATATQARYVKLIGFGRFNTTGDTRKSVWSAVGEIEFFKSSNLNTESFKLNSLVNIFPNPASSTITVLDKHNFIDKNITILNLQGKVVLRHKKTSSENNIKVNVSSLSKGLYVLQVMNNGKPYYQKLIIN